MRLICGLALIFAANWAGAQNLIVNGDFATDLSGWDAPFGSPEWSSEDADGSAESGSLRLVDAGEFGVQFTQCISPEPEGPVTVSAEYLIPPGVTSQNFSLTLFLTWYDDPDCVTALSAQNVEPDVVVREVWTVFSETVVAPAGADSLQVSPLMPGPGGSDQEIFVDNIFVGDALFADSFETP